MSEVTEEIQEVKTVEITKEQKIARREKNIRLAKLFFQVLAYFAAILFVGMIITIIALFGIAATSGTTGFGDSEKYIIGIIGIPLFSVILLSGIVVAIIDLRSIVLENEGKVKEFKLIKEEKMNV